MDKTIQNIKDLRPRQAQFLDFYFRYGNGTRAYMEAYGIKNEASAAVLASRLLKKTGDVTRGLYEQAGLGMDTIIQGLVAATKAEKNMVIHKKDGSRIVTAGPDHLLRLKAIEMIYKFSGYEADMKKSKAEDQFNVQHVHIINNKEKSVFRVGSTDE